MHRRSTAFERLCWHKPTFTAIYNFYVRNHRHLVLSPKEISIDMIEYRLATTWDNVERIGTMHSNEVLLLRRPVALKGWMAWGYRLFGGDRGMAPAPFGQLRDDSDLVRDRHHYAPHLFTKHHERDEEMRT